MDHREVGRYWNENAEVWTRLSRQGYDTYRDHLNTPAFLAMLPEVRGRNGLDIGCGEGYNTRQLARRVARMTAIDVAEVFIGHARAEEEREPLGIEYQVASAVALPFGDASFDFCTGFMSFMDIPEPKLVVREAYRVLKPGGFLQFSITHPCFNTPGRRNLRDENGRTYAFEIGDYFGTEDAVIQEWTFSAAPKDIRDSVRPFRVPAFNRTLSQWFNLLLGTGFVLEQVEEPRPSDEVVAQHPNLQDAQVVPYCLLLRVSKPAWPQTVGGGIDSGGAVRMMSGRRSWHRRQRRSAIAAQSLREGVRCGPSLWKSSDSMRS